MHAIESIGPVLGIVAFVGLAILAFLLFQQARDIRRLREWAGRAPERANEAADAVQAAADASREGDAGEEAGAVGGGGRLRSAWDRFAYAVRDRFAAIDRRLPVDGRYIVAALVVAIVAVGVVTSGFGLVGGGSDKGSHHKKKLPTVAVVNGTGTSGLAATVEDKVVKKAGYEPGAVGNATASVNATVVEYVSGKRSEAEDLAKAVKPKLGETPVQPMTSDIRNVAGKADLALVLGLDDAGFDGGG
jgi:LytR cell envelope-related transcriptional attenuator